LGPETPRLGHSQLQAGCQRPIIMFAPKLNYTLRLS